MSSTYKVLAQGLNDAKYLCPNNTNTIVSKLKVKNISNQDTTVNISLTQNSASNFSYETKQIITINNSTNYSLNLFLRDDNFGLLEDGTIYYPANLIINGYQTRVVKMLRDGTVDDVYIVNNNLFSNNPAIFGVDVFKNEKVLLYGNQLHTSSNSPNRLYQGLMRLKADGTLDTTFNNGVNANGYPISQNAGYAYVKHATILDNQKILASFVTNTSNNSIIRLNEDGTIDNTFAAVRTNATDGNDQHVDFDVDSNGRIIIRSSFTTVTINGTVYNKTGIARLNSDGTMDNTFNASVSGDYAFYSGSYPISRVKALPNNKIMLALYDGNNGVTVNGVVKKIVVRLNENGSLDETYNTTHTFDPQSGLHSDIFSTLMSDGSVAFKVSPSSPNIRTIDGVFKYRQTGFDSDGYLIDDFDSQNSYPIIMGKKDTIIQEKEVEVGLGTATGYYRTLSKNSNNNKTYLVKNKTLAPLEEINIDGGIVVEENYQLDVRCNGGLESLIQIYGTEEV